MFGAMFGTMFGVMFDAMSYGMFGGVFGRDGKNPRGDGGSRGPEALGAGI